MTFVVAEGEAQVRDAERLAEALDLPLLATHATRGPPPAADTLLLVVTPTGLELRNAGEPRTGGVRARLRPAGRRVSRRQPLGRAIGARARTVLDATAGLGHDAGLMAAMGFDVTAVERSPVLAALLRDAAEREGVAITIILGDARRVLAGIHPPPDVVYVDPMYPPKRRASALARKGVRLVRRLVGDDPDAADLLREARVHAARRVVVKRPGHAEPLAADVSFTIESKLVRYDVYVTRPGEACD